MYCIVFKVDQGQQIRPEDNKVKVGDNKFREGVSGYFWKEIDEHVEKKSKIILEINNHFRNRQSF